MSQDKNPTSQIAIRFKQDLQLKGFAERTQQAYCRALRKFTEFLKHEPDSATEDELRNYLLYIKNDKQFSASSINVAQNGLRTMVTVTISSVYVLTVQAKPISNDAEVRSAWKV